LHHILDGPVVDAPTIIYVLYHLHYSSSFHVWATTNEIKWDKENQLLVWYPSKNKRDNQIVIGIHSDLQSMSFPDEAKSHLEHTKLVGVFQ
jgi:hypothetical protein